jgi:hypothetical protein
MALFTGADDLHHDIEDADNDLEANLMLVKHEARLVMKKFL